MHVLRELLAGELAVGDALTLHERFDPFLGARIASRHHRIGQHLRDDNVILAAREEVENHVRVESTVSAAAAAAPAAAAAASSTSTAAAARLTQNHGRHDEKQQGAAEQKQAETGDSHGGILRFMVPAPARRKRRAYKRKPRERGWTGFSPVHRAFASRPVLQHGPSLIVTPRIAGSLRKSGKVFILSVAQSGEFPTFFPRLKRKRRANLRLRFSLGKTALILPFQRAPSPSPSDRPP